ncbi:hypothetical protein BO224_11680 [Erysipelotrichaceae bacterium NYU-BL-E8]|uniref:Uncharacterized protein n=2 Tax=Ileibacterium valens TaxID=1862668 RepID=A0A1U7NCU2_9FIRM|nr:hypothetical protein [Ileibacterium valens]OLU36549.1 hypothetical protein BO222_12185 [Ileibacterium valens]OLU36883.1 hypothetical protein BO224_11680 [Erysipelotrichaceae bacterium NYU-BL-E8]OLU39619.1 hypothetical protein BM735_07150 [Erysipelotrichaceae bacterium NYU-BL-F16]
MVNTYINVNEEPKNLSNLFELLYVLFSEKVKVDEKLNIMKERFGIRTTEEIRERMLNIESLLDAVVNRELNRILGEKLAIIDELNEQYRREWKKESEEQMQKRVEEQVQKRAEEERKKAKAESRLKFESFLEDLRNSGYSEEQIAELVKIYGSN